MFYKKKGGVWKLSVFSEKAISQYLENYHSTKYSFKRGRLSSVFNHLHITERHFIDLISPTASKENAARCNAVWCSKVDEIRKK